jgi:hypothetical protein
MTNAIHLELPGAEKVVDWFGAWPSFHDAEILSLSLHRSGPSLLRIYPYFPAKPATVEFILEDVTDLALLDFSEQNVIFDLKVERAESQNETPLRLVLFPCFGLAGNIDAKSIRVDVTPGTSPDGVSQW